MLKKGRIRIPHFAHKPPPCPFGSGETEAHRSCKVEIYAALRADPRVSNVELEQDLQGLRPDVAATIGGVSIFVEVQVSKLPLDEIERRTAEYGRRRAPVLWLPQWTDALQEDRYAPRQWERWLHAAQLGRVYYWRNGLDLSPVHFNQYMLWVEGREWHEGGSLQSAGGYERVSKRYKAPVVGPELHLLNDLRPQALTPWRENREFDIPSRVFLLDQRGRWW